MLLQLPHLLQWLLPPVIATASASAAVLAVATRVKLQLSLSLSQLMNRYIAGHQCCNCHRRPSMLLQLHHLLQYLPSSSDVTQLSQSTSAASIDRQYLHCYSKYWSIITTVTPAAPPTTDSSSIDPSSSATDAVPAVSTKDKAPVVSSTGPIQFLDCKAPKLEGIQASLGLQHNHHHHHHWYSTLGVVPADEMFHRCWVVKYRCRTCQKIFQLNFVEYSATTWRNVCYQLILSHDWW